MNMDEDIVLCFIIEECDRVKYGKFLVELILEKIKDSNGAFLLSLIMLSNFRVESTNAMMSPTSLEL